MTDRDRDERQPSEGNPVSNDELAAFDLIASEHVRDDAIPPASGLNDVQSRHGKAESAPDERQPRKDQEDEERTR